MANDPDNAPMGEDPKLESLEDRIAAARKAEDARVAKEHAGMADVRSGALQIASTMVGYPLGGAIVGFLLDSVFNTRPWITIVLMFLAFIGACVQVIRVSGSSNNNSAK